MQEAPGYKLGLLCMEALGCMKTKYRLASRVVYTN